MVGIVEFLNARLEEDERLAKAATPGAWRGAWRDSIEEVGYDYLDYTVEAGDEDVSVSRGDQYGHVNAQHIARHDPARVLREVKAKRQIIVELESLTFSIESGANRGTDNPEGEAYVNGRLAEMERTARVLAAVYADHEDYDHSWA